MFKAIKKIAWNRDGIEVEVVRRYRVNGNRGNCRDVEAEVEERMLIQHGVI